jgi:beta-hydroxylase
MFSPVAIGMLLLGTFVLGSLAYVYRLRGQTRFASLTEYLRKGWPVFAPLNCLLYLFTQRRARAPIMDIREFPELAPIADNWETIRAEALELYQSGAIQATSRAGNASAYDVGFRTFFKQGWSKFYVLWYGETLNSAKRLCPKTAAILAKIPQVNGAMFSLLPPGSQLNRHLDPFAISLRYHLGLATPNSDACFIDVDGQVHSWRDGQPLLFDETFLHFARNDSDQHRLILMCDIERPLWGLGSIVNAGYRRVARLTIVPNMEGDQRGLANRVFQGVSPFLQRAKGLKSTHRTAYRVAKYSINLTVISLVFLTAAAILHAIATMFAAF